MKNILIATHGNLSKEFIETAKLIAGEDIQIEYFCMTKGKSSVQAESEIKSILDSKDKNENVIVLTDVLGGSVANLFTVLLEQYNFHLITGVNLPMVLTTLLSSDENSEDFINEIIKEARNGIQYINDLLNEEENGDDLDDFLNEG